MIRGSQGRRSGEKMKEKGGGWGGCLREGGSKDGEGGGEGCE